MLWTAVRSIAYDMDQRIVSTIHFAGLVKKILFFLSIQIAATATKDINLAKCIASSRTCILKPSICIVAGWLRKILYGKYRITYRIVQGVVNINPAHCQLIRENRIPVPVRAWEVSLSSKVRPSCPASACLFSTPRLSLVLTYGTPFPLPAFRYGFH